MNRQLHVFAGWFFAGVAAAWIIAIVIIYTAAPRPEAGRVAIVFPPSMTDGQALAVITRAGARPIGQGWVRWVWAADLDTASAAALENAGAALVVQKFPFVAALGCAGTPSLAGAKWATGYRATRP